MIELASTVGINNEILRQAPADKITTTSPNALKLDHPAKCISNDSI